MSKTSAHPSRPISGHVFIAASIDGYIARADGDMAWLTKYATGDEDYGYSTFIASIDGVVMGRGTFEKALSFGAWPFKKPVVVMSQTLSQHDLSSDLVGKVRLSRLGPAQLLQMLSGEGWKRVYVDGAKVIQSFLKERLISDMVLTRVPVLLGDGISLFGALATDINLRHVGTVTYPSDLVQSKYEILQSVVPA